MRAIVAFDNEKYIELDSFNYSYDQVGNITQIDKFRKEIQSDSGVFKYGYDNLGRLTEATNNPVGDGSNVKTYHYDSLGNRLRSVYNWVETKHSYNARNQLIQTTEPDIIKEYSYDARGNLKSILENGTLTSSYLFNSANRMVQAITPKGKAEYEYNGFLKRVNKLEELCRGDCPQSPDVTAFSELKYTLDLTKPYNDLLTIGDQRFVWGNGLLQSEGSDEFSYLSDHLGSPIRLMGAEQESLAYDEFGVPMVEAGNSALHNPFGFTEYQADNISGLHYAQARYYAPSLGRFGAEDTHWHTGNMIFGDVKLGNLPNPYAVRQSSNLYDYGLSSPIKYIDPLGKDVWLVHGTTGVASQSGSDDGLQHWQTDNIYNPSDFIEFLGGIFNQTIRYDFTWRGGNSTGDRRDTATDLADQIRNAHIANPNEPIRIVGYSHGGNVPIEAVNILYQQGIDVETLITVATPNRIAYSLNRNVSVGQFINIYNRWDAVQMIGGNDTPWFAHSFWEGAWDVLTMFSPVRNTARGRMGAENVRVTTGVSRLALWNWFYSNHALMHSNIEIWEKYILPLLDLSEFQLESTCSQGGS
ncbi:MAG: hypothetical protein FWC13_04195 [Oscillospiraceae bacterium]|nr:hypothetical protein [Oscillospiraceae bacterium]